MFLAGRRMKAYQKVLRHLFYFLKKSLKQLNQQLCEGLISSSRLMEIIFDAFVQPATGTGIFN